MKNYLVCNRLSLLVYCHEAFHSLTLTEFLSTETLSFRKLKSVSLLITMNGVISPAVLVMFLSSGESLAFQVGFIMKVIMSDTPSS